MEKCSACGAPLRDGICPYCGAISPRGNVEAPAPVAQQVVAPQPQVVINQTVSNAYADTDEPLKRKWTAFVLCLLLGYLGAHYFYVGKPVMGVLYLFTFGLLGIGWIIDIVRILLGSFRDRAGRRLQG